MIDSTVVLWFTAVSSLILLIYLVLLQAKDPVVERLGELNRGASGAKRPAHQSPDDGWKPLEKVTRRRFRRERRETQLKDRLAHAGVHSSSMARFFQVLRWGLLVVPVGFGLAAGQAGYMPLSQGILLLVWTGRSWFVFLVRSMYSSRSA
jgi:hypothetical protein